MAPHDVVEAVCARGERPVWPADAPAELVALSQDCWATDPTARPLFVEVADRLRAIVYPNTAAAVRAPEKDVGESVASGMTGAHTDILQHVPFPRGFIQSHTATHSHAVLS